MNTVPPPAQERPKLEGPSPNDPIGMQRFAPPPSRRRRAFWFLVFLVIAVVVLGGFYGFEQFKQKMIGQYFASMVPPPTVVATAKAGSESVPQYYEAIGTVTAVHQVTISPEVEGRITAIKFESGDVVKQGQLLVQLDDASERADLATYQAQSHLAQVNLDRARQLAQRQYGSKQDVDVQQSTLDQANAGIAKAQTSIGYMAIKAPFDGVLGIRQVNPGQYLAAGAPIVGLTDLDALYVDFTLPEQDRAQLHTAQEMQLHLDAYPDRTFAAQVQSIDPQVDVNTRSIKVRAELSNPDHALQPGMYANVDVVLPSLTDQVTIPEAAIDYTVYGDTVYVVKPGTDKDGKPLLDKDGKPQLTAQQVFVTVGQRFGNKADILKGVAAGDMVVVGGQLKLHNGAPVSLSDDKSLVDPTTLPVE
jgi:multidrug efflux system membrane fusion protein